MIIRVCQLFGVKKMTLKILRMLHKSEPSLMHVMKKHEFEIQDQTSELLIAGSNTSSFSIKSPFKEIT